MKFIPQSIPDVILIELIVHRDERGYLVETFRQDMLDQILGYKVNFIQDNESKSISRGILRGLHYQSPPYTQSKLVRVIKGKVLDVAVDIRMDSPTFLQWHAEELSENNNKSMYIPDGFAHGFQTLEDNCELLYLHSEFYTPGAEDSINVLDSKISMEWPLNITQISKRDSAQPMIDINIFKGVKVV